MTLDSEYMLPGQVLEPSLAPLVLCAVRLLDFTEG